MKVRCIGEDPWVTTGREYLVLSVYGRTASIKYRIIGDDGRTPTLLAAELFELTSEEIPADWIFRVYPALEWVMTPAAWAGTGFWTAYFDGEAEAKVIFTRILLMMQDRSG